MLTPCPPPPSPPWPQQLSQPPPLHNRNEICPAVECWRPRAHSPARPNHTQVTGELQVCEDYGFAGQTAWTAVNYFDRYLAAATETPKRKVELISLSCLLVSSKFLECRSPSLEDLCTLSQNRLTKEDFMRSELMILTKVDWQLAVPSPHQYLLHIMHLLDSSGDCANKHHGPMLIQKHAEFFIDLSAFGA